MRKYGLAALIVAMVLLGGSPRALQPAPAVAATQPNIVFILTDDQSYWDLAHMANVQSELVARGESFSHYYVSNSLCCPSRATILTGRDSASTDVWDNIPPNGGWQTFHALGEDASTVATWLHGAGYQTSLEGKYLNGYGPKKKYPLQTPPGWDDWHALILSANGPDGEGFGGYFNYRTDDNGVMNAHGSDQSDYSTTVLGQDAVRFIDDADPAKPLFVYLAPRAPHGPATAEAAYDGDPRCQVPAPRFPDFNRIQSGAPAYIASLGPKHPTSVDAVNTRRCQTLLSVDDQVGRIVAALAATGRLANTMIVFTSDNGFSLGEHRWGGKKVPYEESTRVPMVIRWDDNPSIAPGSVDSDLTSNIDVASTLADAAGTDAPGSQGSDMLSATGDTLVPLMHESVKGRVPTYCGAHTASLVYVQYATGEQELYDLSADPYEMENLASDPNEAATVAALHAEAMAACTPRPPGWPTTIG